MMKKIILLLCTAVLLCGCGKGTITIEKTIETKKTEKANKRFFEDSEQFKIAKKFKDGNNVIIYDTRTKVMYLILNSGTYTSSITPLYNADGSLRIYDGE